MNRDAMRASLRLLESNLPRRKHEARALNSRQGYATPKRLRDQILEMALKKTDAEIADELRIDKHAVRRVRAKAGKTRRRRST